MARTIKHHVSVGKAKMPKIDKGTKVNIRKMLLKDLEDDYHIDLEFVEI